MLIYMAVKHILRATCPRDRRKLARRRPATPGRLLAPRARFPSRASSAAASRGRGRQKPSRAWAGAQSGAWHGSWVWRRGRGGGPRKCQRCRRQRRSTRIEYRDDSNVSMPWSIHDTITCTHSTYIAASKVEAKERSQRAAGIVTLELVTRHACPGKASQLETHGNGCKMHNGHGNAAWIQKLEALAVAALCPCESPCVWAEEEIISFNLAAPYSWKETCTHRRSSHSAGDPGSHHAMSASF